MYSNRSSHLALSPRWKQALVVLAAITESP